MSSRAFLVNSGVLFLLTVSGVAFAYFYSGLLLGDSFASWGAVLKAGALQSLYYSFVLGLLILLGTFFRKPFFAGVLTLAVVYGMSAIGSVLPGITRYLPGQMLTEAGFFEFLPSKDLMVSMLWTCGCIAIFLIVSGAKLAWDELV